MVPVRFDKLDKTEDAFSLIGLSCLLVSASRVVLDGW